MKQKGKNLEFISLIKRDGTGTIMCGTEWDDQCGFPRTDNMSYLDNELFFLTSLSLTERTFIASGFNSFVVKLK